MDDLISRRKAIDAAECIVEHHSITPYKTMAAAMDHLKRILNGMPSAQPQWIPVTERLPENGHYYLWCSNGGNVQSDYYWDGFENGQKYGYTIVAWMPLPDPWKGE